MRRDDLYLNDIVEASDYIAAFIAEAYFEAFRSRRYSGAPLFKNSRSSARLRLICPKGLETFILILRGRKSWHSGTF